MENSITNLKVSGPKFDYHYEVKGPIIKFENDKDYHLAQASNSPKDGTDYSKQVYEIQKGLSVFFNNSSNNSENSTVA